MKNKNKNTLIFGTVGLAVGFSVSKFILKKSSGNNIISSVIGLLVGGCIGYFSSEKELFGEGKVDSESKKNKIVFTRED